MGLITLQRYLLIVPQSRSETKNSQSRFRYGFIIYLLLARQLSLFICLANEALHLPSLSDLNF